MNISAAFSYPTASIIPFPMRKLKNEPPKKINSKSKKNPYRSNTYWNLSVFAGSIEKSTRDPSNGGMGKKLNTARIIFANTIIPKKNEHAGREIRHKPNN